MKYIVKNDRLFPSTDNNGYRIGAFVQPPTVESGKMAIPNGFKLENDLWVNDWAVVDAPAVDVALESVEADKDYLRSANTNVSELSGDSKDSLLAKCINIIKSIF